MENWDLKNSIVGKNGTGSSNELSGQIQGEVPAECVQSTDVLVEDDKICALHSGWLLGQLLSQFSSSQVSRTVFARFFLRRGD